MSTERNVILTLVLVLIWVMMGMTLEVAFASYRGDKKVERVRAIGERNLTQAEDMLRACFRHAVFFVGQSIYKCVATKSTLTVSDLQPELSNLKGSVRVVLPYSDDEEDINTHAK